MTSSLIDPLSRRRGVALLMVLLIVLAITILATGFVAGTDTELACGANTLMRVQMDQLAESGLEHARGLLLHPQDVPADFWTNGATDQQLAAGSRDYYDVRTTRDVNQPTDYCTYDITCEAFRLVGSERTGRSRLAATLAAGPLHRTVEQRQPRFPPDVAASMAICAAEARSSAWRRQPSIDGDAFTDSLKGSIVGHSERRQPIVPGMASCDADLHQPGVRQRHGVGGTLSGSTYPPAIWRSAGNLVLAGNVTIQGMLLVGGNLTIRGNANRIVAAQQAAGALCERQSDDRATSTVFRSKDSRWWISDVQINAAAHQRAVSSGALFVGGTLVETTADVSGHGHTGLIRGNPAWTGGRLGSALQLDGLDDYIDCGTNAAFRPEQLDHRGGLGQSPGRGGRQVPSLCHQGRPHLFAPTPSSGRGPSSDSIEFFIYDADLAVGPVPCHRRLQR